MTEIKLPNSYKIVSDMNQWTLLKMSGKRFRIIAYFPEIDDCIMEYFKVNLRLSACKSIQELIDLQKDLVIQLNTALAPFHIEVRHNARPEESKA